MPRNRDSYFLIGKPSLAAAGIVISLAFLAWKVVVFRSHSFQPAPWIHAFDEILPPWTRIALHVLLYGILLIWFVQVLRESQGAERLFLALLLAKGLLFPAQFLLGPATAWALFLLQTAADIVMLFAAVQLYRELMRERSSEAKRLY